MPAADLGALVVKEVLRRVGIRPEMVDEVIMGHVLANDEAPNIARLAALKAGLPIQTTAYTVERQCGSSLQAIINASLLVESGNADVVVAGGVESMSNAEYYVTGARWGLRLGNGGFHDRWAQVSKNVSCPDVFGPLESIMLTAEKQAEIYDNSRQEQDRFALSSHQKAIAAIDTRLFRQEIVPVEVPQKKGPPIVIDTDKHLRRGMTAEGLAALPPVIGKTVTAGNSSGLNDVAAACVLVSRETASRLELEPLGHGKILGGMGLTESGAGSDAGATATMAVEEGDSWVLDGSKMFTTDSETTMTGFVVIAACTGTRSDGKKAISTFIVPGGARGFTFSKPPKNIGLDVSDTHELSLLVCRVPAEIMLGERGNGFRQLLRVLDDGRVEVAAMALGIAQGCLDLSLRYAKERQHFGRPFSQFQAIQFKLADMATEVEMAGLMVYKAATLRDQGRPFGKEASMAKLFGSETAQRAAIEGVQIHGGYGYMKEYAISRLYRDAKDFTIVEGTSEIQRMVVAR